MKNVTIITTFLATMWMTSCGDQKSQNSALADAPRDVSTLKLMISVQKSTVKPTKVEKSVSLLSQFSVTPHPCYDNATVTQYIDYSFAPEAPYYGVAMVTLMSTCDQAKNAYLNRVMQDKRFMLWSNPQIGPTPNIGVSN